MQMEAASRTGVQPRGRGRGRGRTGRTSPFGSPSMGPEGPAIRDILEQMEKQVRVVPILNILLERYSILLLSVACYHKFRL